MQARHRCARIFDVDRFASLVARRTGAIVVGATAVLSIAACGRPSPAHVASAGRNAAPLKSDAEIRDLDIEYYLARANRDPTGAMDLAHVGALHLARGRETGDPREAILAEEAARRSLHNRSVANIGAAQVLESASKAARGRTIRHGFEPATLAGKGPSITRDDIHRLFPERLA